MALTRPDRPGREGCMFGGTPLQWHAASARPPSRSRSSRSWLRLACWRWLYRQPGRAPETAARNALSARMLTFGPGTTSGPTIPHTTSRIASAQPLNPRVRPSIVRRQPSQRSERSQPSQASQPSQPSQPSQASRRSQPNTPSQRSMRSQQSPRVRPSPRSQPRRLSRRNPHSRRNPRPPAGSHRSHRSRRSDHSCSNPPPHRRRPLRRSRLRLHRPLRQTRLRRRP